MGTLAGTLDRCVDHPLLVAEPRSSSFACMGIRAGVTYVDKHEHGIWCMAQGCADFIAALRFTDS